MFLLNSCLSLFSAALSLGHPLSRSYGVILPSSLTMLLPPALGFSPHPPVSVYGTGTVYTIAAFLGSRNHTLHYLFFVPHLALDYVTDLPFTLLLHLLRSFHSRIVLSFCVPTFLIYCSAGISTCCPSDTPFGLSLGPDLPREDQLYPGNLRYSAWRILTSISLLIPAFSLHTSPHLLAVMLLRDVNAPLPTLRFLSFGVVF